MNTLQIQKALSENPTTRDIFLNVYPSDALPQKMTKYPAAFIVNVDSSTEPGSHWLAFYLQNPRCVEFFDSFGKPPQTFQGPIQQYVKKFKEMKFNAKTLQSQTSAVCGQYCIYYIYSRCRGLHMKDIVQGFGPHLLSNDKKVYAYVTKYFYVKASFYQ